MRSTVNLQQLFTGASACGQQIPMPKLGKVKRGVYMQENVWQQENLCARTQSKGAASGDIFSKPVQVPETARIAKVTYLQSTVIKAKQKGCQLKTLNDFQQQRNLWTLFDRAYSA